MNKWIICTTHLNCLSFLHSTRSTHGSEYLLDKHHRSQLTITISINHFVSWMNPWITITEAALEIRDQAGGFATGDFFGFATTFFSGALRLVPAARPRSSSAKLWRCSSSASRQPWPVLAATVLAAVGLAGLGSLLLGGVGVVPGRRSKARRRGGAVAREGAAALSRVAREGERRRWRWIDPRVDWGRSTSQP